MMRVAEQQRRVEGREIVAVLVVGILESGPGRVRQKAREHDEDTERRKPPGVAAHRLAESATPELNDWLRHRAWISGVKSREGREGARVAEEATAHARAWRMA